MMSVQYALPMHPYRVQYRRLLLGVLSANRHLWRPRGRGSTTVHFRPVCPPPPSYPELSTMGDLSDLDLVAQAMAPTNAPDSARAADSPANANANAEGENPSSLPPSADNIDLSSLTPEDLAMLQPILSALNIDDPDSLDEGALEDILKQMDAAGEVADDLEGKLDRLIGELGKVEEGILEGMGEEDKAKVKAGGEGSGKDKEERAE